MTWKSQVVTAAAGIVVFSLAAFAQTPAEARDERLVSFIHEANLREIEVATLADGRSDSPPVKSFAATMSRDHLFADRQLRAWAAGHGIDLDSLRDRISRIEEDRIEEERRARTVGSATGEWARTWEETLRASDARTSDLDVLSGLRGAAFDREMVRAVLDAHRKMIARLSAARDRSVSPDLRAVIDALLATLKRHREMAQALQATLAKA